MNNTRHIPTQLKNSKFSSNVYTYMCVHAFWLVKGVCRERSNVIHIASLVTEKSLLEV